jgi:hypothetical protein
MAVKNSTEEMQKEKLVDDLSATMGINLKDNLSDDKLEKLKARLASKNKATEEYKEWRIFLMQMSYRVVSCVGSSE